MLFLKCPHPRATPPRPPAAWGVLPCLEVALAADILCLCSWLVSLIPLINKDLLSFQLTGHRPPGTWGWTRPEGRVLALHHGGARLCWFPSSVSCSVAQSRTQKSVNELLNMSKQINLFHSQKLVCLFYKVVSKYMKTSMSDKIV